MHDAGHRITRAERALGDCAIGDGVLEGDEVGANIQRLRQGRHARTQAWLKSWRAASSVSPLTRMTGMARVASVERGARNTRPPGLAGSPGSSTIACG